MLREKRTERLAHEIGKRSPFGEGDRAESLVLLGFDHSEQGHRCGQLLVSDADRSASRAEF